MESITARSCTFLAIALGVLLVVPGFAQIKMPPLGDSDGTRLPGKFIWVDLVKETR